MAEFYGNYIDGRWVPAKSGRRSPSLDPATGEVLGEVARSGPEDVDEAVEAARRAFRTWRLTPAPKRGEILYRAAELLRDRKEELAAMLTREMGKVLAEARGDVQEAIDITYFMAGEGRRQFGHTVPSELPDKWAMAVRDPIGVVAVITPWNFPTAIPSWKIMPALVLGNTVVFKPASDTPILAAMLVGILEEAGLPPGVVNLVFGGGEEVGEALLRHPGVDMISFTGSVESGQHVAEVAARHGLKRVSLELGGKNAVIVLADADLDLAVDGIIWSAYGTTGQRCTACSRLIVERAVAEELEERIAARARSLRLGHGLRPETEVGPLINRTALERVKSYVEVGRREGARLVVGGEEAEVPGLAGAFFQPTVFADVRPEMRIAREEIFGPVLSLIPVDGLEEAIEVNNGVQYGLSSSLYTRDVHRAFRAIRDLATGIVYINAGTIGAEIQLPFGGYRMTGNGHREAGIAALDTYSEWKSIYVDFSGRLQRAQIDTH
ncbi:MAG: aldehyde dehydrogenase family protein [Clostridia bacterium]|nr:aldehyde dehydrogenase family protein [Clostridia bacterium]